MTQPWFLHPDGSIIHDMKDLPRVVNVKCGSCKATGTRQVWNDEALLVPTDPPEPCGACNGTGYAIKA